MWNIMNVLFNIRSFIPDQLSCSIRFETIQPLCWTRHFYFFSLAFPFKNYWIKYIARVFFSADTLAIVRQVRIFHGTSKYVLDSVIVIGNCISSKRNNRTSDTVCMESRQTMREKEHECVAWKKLMLITTKCRNNRRWRYSNYHIDCMKSLMGMTQKSQIKLLVTIEARSSIRQEIMYASARIGSFESVFFHSIW